MWGKSARGRAAITAVFVVALMSVGLAAASADEWTYGSITAESTGCETVTIYYDGPALHYSQSSDVEYLPYNSQGTVNGDVRNGNGLGSSQIVFTNVAPGLADWSGSIWYEYGPPATQYQYFDQGTVQVEPCPATTTTTTTMPGETTTSTIGQVETDLPEQPGSGFGLIAALAAIGVALLGGAALIATRRENQ